MGKRIFLYVRPSCTRSLVRVFVIRKKKLRILGYQKMRPLKILIRLREGAGWSESSLGEHARSYVSDVTTQICTQLFYVSARCSMKIMLSQTEIFTIMFRKCGIFRRDYLFFFTYACFGKTDIDAISKRWEFKDYYNHIYIYIYIYKGGA